MSRVQKVPSLFLIRFVFDFSLLFSLVIGLSGLLVSVAGIKFSKNKIKLLMAWSSVGKMSLIICLLNLYFKMALVYFICYVFRVFGIGLVLFKKKVEVLKREELRGIKIDSLINIRLAVLIFSGLPPLLGFVRKVYLFSGLSIKERELMLKQIEVMDKKNYMVEFPIYKKLRG